MKLHIHSRRKRKKGDTAQLAAQLAPLEEVDQSSAAKQVGAANVPSEDPHLDPHYGAIVVDNEGLHVPQDIMEGGTEKTYLGMEPVVLVILAVMLVFIAFIAWQITLLPIE
jgi:hypothetical protein